MTERRYPRFSLAQRAEHAVLVISFTVLAVTGLPQKYIGSGWAQAAIGLMGGIETTRLIHHAAAVVLMLETVYHLVAVGYRLYVRRVRPSLLPGVGDFKEAWGSLLFNLGLRPTRPPAGRYSYGEKLEYWAVVWGTVVMVITGFMMWNPIATTRLLPGEFIPAAKAAHGGEALLAVLAIVVWHIYHVHIRHFNRSMFTGWLGEREMRAEHPLELAELNAGPPADRPAGAAERRRARRYAPVAVGLAAGLLFGLFRFVTFEETAIETVQRGRVAEAFAPQTATPLPTPRPTPTSLPLLPVWQDNIGLVLLQKCGDCHDGGTARLDLTTYAGVRAGGKSGPVLTPGDPEASLLVTKLEKPHPGGLTEAELEVIKAWIAAGAPGP